MVHTKVYVPGVVKPLTAVFLLEGFAIVAVLEVVQIPEPGLGLLPAKLVVPGTVQIC